MDPLTLGAIGSQNLTHLAVKKPAKYVQLKLAGILGFLAGLSADLDVLIQSDNDALLALEYHRQFTHSLIFIPLGGLD